MATIIKDGIEFEIPDGAYQGREINARAGVSNAFPVVYREGKHIPIEPGEVIDVTPHDRISFVTPMETAGKRW